MPKSYGQFELEADAVEDIEGGRELGLKKHEFDGLEITSEQERRGVKVVSRRLCDTGVDDDAVLFVFKRLASKV